jgi:hypothetical protein
MAIKGIKVPKKKPRAQARRKAGSTELDWSQSASWDGEKFHKARHAAFDDYYYNFKPADLIATVWDWMKQQKYTANQIKFAKAAPYIPVQAGIIARCLLNGMPDFHNGHADYWRGLGGTSGELKPASESLITHINEAIRAGEPIVRARIAEERAVQTSQVKQRTIQEVMYDTAVNIASDIDTFCEEFMATPDPAKLKDFNPVSVLRKNECKPNHARIIRKFYEGEHSEFVELNSRVAKSEQDENRLQLEEGYSHLNAKQRKAFEDLYTKILNACDIVIAEAKSLPAPRKVKAKSPEQLVSKLKFKASDTTYGIASVPPVGLVGAVAAVVFNCKTRKLGLYIAEDGDGFVVKGTTILRFNEITSLQKTLRKPEEILPQFKKTTKPRTIKLFEEIKTTETKLTGRFNEDTVILAVFK